MDVPTDDSTTDDDDDEGVPPDHPMSTEQCDHALCSNPSPGRQRICDDCTPIMLASAPNECGYCGVSVRS